jgi:hypothetical protein
MEFMAGAGLGRALCMAGAHITCEVWRGQLGVVCRESVHHALCGSHDPR